MDTTSNGKIAFLVCSSGNVFLFISIKLKLQFFIRDAVEACFSETLKDFV